MIENKVILKMVSLVFLRNNSLLKCDVQGFLTLLWTC